MICGKKIEPQKHLIIFDEVQECPDALNCLKYFYENANEYHVISAGTLLAQPQSYPVGKVNVLNKSFIKTAKCGRLYVNMAIAKLYI